MTDVFISYARETAATARRVADALRGEELVVWQDDELPSHRPFGDVIEERLSAAKAVVVLWSEPAVLSQWVRSEAGRAREDAKLVQARLDDAVLPIPFDQFQCCDLRHWAGDKGAPEWRKLLAQVGTLIAADPTRSPVPLIGQLAGKVPFQRPARPSIAVLPFKNASNDADTAYLVESISEDIVTALSRWHDFFVIAATSSFALRDHSADPVRVARQLGVRYVLSGSIRKAADRIRLTAQLIDATDGPTVWADKFDRELVDVLALEDEMTEQVVTAIEPAVLHSEGARTLRQSPRDFNALDCFFRGMWHLNQASREGYDGALASFRRAIRRDRKLALGHIGLSRILFGGAIYGWSDNPERDLVEARQAAQTAIGLEPRDAYGYFAAAGASLYLGDHGAALSEARTAVQLNSNCALAHMRLGQVLTFSGRPADAIAPIERCIRHSPYDPQLGVMLDSLALAHFQARHYDQAAALAEAAMNRARATESVLLAACYARLDRMDDAVRVYPRTKWTGSIQRPAVASFADPADGLHLRGAVDAAKRAAQAAVEPAYGSGSSG